MNRIVQDALEEANKLLADRQKKKKGKTLEEVIESINEEISLDLVETELLT